MSTLTTNGIKISVFPNFHQEHSNPSKHKYVFSYQVTIENKSSETVQLLRRHWFIFDSNGSYREVEGEGVIGKTPILAPGESHQYISWCPLMTQIGRMYGTYLMQQMDTSEKFKVKIPEFHLVVPAVLN